jgi:hypothetical protein
MLLRDCEAIRSALLGRRVAALYVCPGESELWLEFEDGRAGLSTVGECCSESWFADITGVEALLGSTIRSVEFTELGDATDARTRQESDAAYSIEIKSDGGTTSIIFRNSSNGYYGGWVVLTADKPAPELSRWRRITADWSA